MRPLKTLVFATGTYPLTQGRFCRTRWALKHPVGCIAPFWSTWPAQQGTVLMGAQVPVLHPHHHLVWVLEAIIW